MTALIVERVTPYIMRLTINRPDARNAINGDIATALERAVKDTEADDTVRAVILTGAGTVFSAGADLKAIAGGRSTDLVTDDGGFAGFVHAKRSKPWIAAVNGPALAGGTEIVLACDMVVAADDASFGLPEVKRGLAAFAGGLYRLPRAFPRALALEAIATGDPITAREAERFGMVNKLASKADVAEEAVALAERIAVNAPVAVRKSLAIARSAFELDDATLEGRVAVAARELASTDDYQEGPRAFIEKRAPNWVGR